MPDFFGVVHKTPTNEFTVDFPDCPGCTAVGTTFTEAELLAAEALQRHVEALGAAGTPLPRPSTIAAVKEDPASRGGVIIAVPVTARRRPPKAASAARHDQRAKRHDKQAERAGDDEDHVEAVER